MPLETTSAPLILPPISQRWTLFSEAIHLVFTKWEALAIAIDHNPFPRQPDDSPLEELAHHTLAFFQENGSSVELNELVGNFEFYFQEQLDVEVDDGSCWSVGKKLLALHKEIVIDGLTSRVEDLRQNAVKARPQVQVQVDPDLSESDDDAPISSQEQESVSESMEVDSQTQQAPQGPIVDEEGFTMVTRKNNRRKR